MPIKFPHTVSTEKGPVTFRSVGEPITEVAPDPSQLCRQCGTWLNPVARMLGPVCGTCTRKNHEDATR